MNFYRMSYSTTTSSSSSRDVSISSYSDTFPKTSFRKLHDAGSRISLHFQMVGLQPPQSQSHTKSQYEKRLLQKSQPQTREAFVVKTFYHYE